MCDCMSEDGLTEACPLDGFLEQAGLGEVGEALRQLGVKSLSDLAYVDKDMADRQGIPPESYSALRGALRQRMVADSEGGEELRLFLAEFGLEGSVEGLRQDGVVTLKGLWGCIGQASWFWSELLPVQSAKLKKKLSEKVKVERSDRTARNILCTVSQSLRLSDCGMGRARGLSLGIRSVEFRLGALPLHRHPPLPKTAP